MSAKTTAAPGVDIQANLARASRFSDGRARNWSLFFFFRVMSQAEIRDTTKRTSDLLRSLSLEAQGVEAKAKAGRLQTTKLLRRLRLDLSDPSLFRSKARKDRAAEAPSPQAKQFRHWLSALVLGQGGDLQADAQAMMTTLLPPDAQAPAEKGFSGFLSSLGPTADPLGEMLSVSEWASRPEAWAAALESYGGVDEAGLKALEQGLAGVVRYEILRQGAPAFLPTTPESRPRSPIIRSEAIEERLAAAATQADLGYDETPINYAFTWNGLKALGLDKGTLASFPEPFKDGMAKRAERLRDTGPNAPPYWENVYGLPQVHGYFTGGFLVGGKERLVKEELWRRLRREVAAFNAPDSNSEGEGLRARIGAMFRPFGLEILHIEIGQEPYELWTSDADDCQYARPTRHRVEHFGFRDGLSQPFANLGLGDARPGQGTPSRNRTWSPVAPGELYLDQPDEDGRAARQPANQTLRRNGTYVVFRKLEQDVAGFRSYFARMTRNDPGEAARLAAEFVGRWPSGAPLVRSPDFDRGVSEGAEDALNDFLFAADDPKGEKCPLGAHVRRANPRDIGGRGEARRHRLLRRSISYGGPLLDPDSLGDGQPRGLLFIAMNARIDQQFEVVQAEWLNSGEFLGQAGLGRCPLTGNNSGGRLDSFWRASDASPVTGIPSFVTMRGGEYFFAPGLEALRAILAGEELSPESATPQEAQGLASAKTSGLFGPDRLAPYAFRILSSQPHAAAIKVRIPSETAENMVFVGRYDDVVQVLSNPPQGCPLQLSVRPYQESARRMTRGHDFVISTDGPDPTRERLLSILNAAWDTLKARRPLDDDMSAVIQGRLAMALRRCGPVGRIDLVDDLATAAAHGVAAEIYGVPGPTWVTELAAALPLGQQHLSEMPADWLRVLSASAPNDPGLISLQTWSAVMLADTIANLQSAQEAWAISRQAGGEMLAHIDDLLTQAQSGPAVSGYTLVDAFVENADRFVGDVEKPYQNAEKYFHEAAVIIAEVTANTVAATPSAFGGIMEFLLENNLSLRGLACREGEDLCPSLARRVIYESDRLDPVLPVLQRLCVEDVDLESGIRLTAGDRVAALMKAASLSGFVDPYEFALDPARRPPERYLMFGPQQGGRECWGKEQAMSILSASLLAAASFDDLRGVAGVQGGPRKVLGALTIALPARFTPKQAGL